MSHCRAKPERDGPSLFAIPFMKALLPLFLIILDLQNIPHYRGTIQEELCEAFILSKVIDCSSAENVSPKLFLSVLLSNHLEYGTYMYLFSGCFVQANGPVDTILKRMCRRKHVAPLLFIFSTHTKLGLHDRLSHLDLEPSTKS